ncbi:sulfate adenylyltransferase [Leptolyngbya sp. 'hensonii']|uniref:sulfate adenylyltransferase n=1 Tax=Leptolyngbya sp. 'hensonii' TaxID=1922337 RepID=UPI0009503361|nr:sulfate adenylyltransferase [Leptolyngbya sp. 'hensonii']OLP19611.1 sulfate adenylyltransferase [Leptolyngbya sp. 'hensonii']
MSHPDGIAPHGGRLINRITTSEQRQEFLSKADFLPRIQLSERSVSDLEMIAIGGFSPLTGFMEEADYSRVVLEMHLQNDLPWSIPITLPVSQEEADTLKEGSLVRLDNPQGRFIGVLELTQKYHYDKLREAVNVYRTNDEKHPGVAVVYKQGPVYLAGPVWLLERDPHALFPLYQIDPIDSRILFKQKEWKTIVGFQTRNPIHRAHEYIQKCALETVDGLFLHPLVGVTKGDDIPADVRMRCYEIMLEHYFPKDRVILAINPAAMRYAGPREAIFHALVRKNYGCTHFIVGRDHAGVGDYYGTYDAQHIFDEFAADELGIVPMKFEHAFYCKRTQSMATVKTSPSSREERVHLSGTKVREMLRNGELPPPEFSRPEVARELIRAMQVSCTLGPDGRNGDGI